VNYLRFALLLVPLMLAGAEATAPIWAHGDVDVQVAALDEKIRLDPQNAVLYLKRGELYRLLRHWTEAESDFTRAERLDGHLAAVHLSRALLLESGRPDAALTAVERFLAAEPGRSDAHELRGRILFRLGRHREAIPAFTRAIQLRDDPTADLYLERNEAVLAERPESLNDAIEGLDEAIARLGPIVTLELPAIDLAVRTRNWKDALRRIDEAAGRSPRPENWLVRRGETLMQAGRHADAQQAFLAALRAIEALPQRQRATTATQQLETQVRKRMLEFHPGTSQENGQYGDAPK
jgi:tetratricopeptide (TPR) repeat protein